MNDQVILTIAEAILANTKVLQSLIDHLPVEVKAEVAKKVTPIKATPVVPAEVTTVPAAHAPLPQPAPVAAPVVVAPVAAPVVVAPVVAAPVVSSVVAPFSDSKGMIAYVMSVYQTVGAAKGQGIQNILESLGHKNINDVRVDQYGELFTKLEAFK